MKKVIAILLMAVLVAGIVSAKELETYERKSLFLFPVQFSADVDQALVTQERRDKIDTEIYDMVVKEFTRVDFFDVQAEQSFTAFLENADAYIRDNARDIASQRMDADGKFKEAMVTLDDLLKTLENSYTLVPYVDSIKEEVKTKTFEEGDKDVDLPVSYKYVIYMHLDLYSTSTGAKLRTIKVNNGSNLMGMLFSSVGDSLVNDDSRKTEDELEALKTRQFNAAVSGLLTVLKKDMRALPEFKIKTVASTVTAGSIGFDMGKDTGIRMDQRYKAYTYDAEGNRHMTAFAKIRKIDANYSEAQVLIGRSEEGDQIMEDPKLGLNIYAGMAFVPFKLAPINGGPALIEGQHAAFLAGAEYNLASSLNISELYLTANARISAPSFEDIVPDDWTMNVATIDVGLMKKFYLSRLAITAGLSGTYSSYSWAPDDETWEYTAHSMGMTVRGGAEILITPEFTAFGQLTYDVLGNPTEITEEVSGDTFSMDDMWLEDFNAGGVGMAFGIGITF
ncbi:MAG TPA: hypothetical protein PLF44_01015 [Candidatus Mcinerneyibacteriales bacterium]|nr:hypothetical protein [Candidatus Mcinerneyibacteriales bacterium]HPJ69439.1 hypothetical protein [Candidatus Mcinerneyibacteriales bacterium]HPQ89155.1 hypothetical protein [Candidatus Mcinerneyibacteriales bacterium]